MYVRMYVCMYVCMYACMYVCIYVEVNAPVGEIQKRWKHLEVQRPEVKPLYRWLFNCFVLGSVIIQIQCDHSHITLDYSSTWAET